MRGDTSAIHLHAQPLGDRTLGLSGLPPDVLLDRLQHLLPADLVIHPFGSVPRLELVDPTALSEREIDVLRLISRGLSNEEIAERLFLSLNTIKSHIRMAYRKMGVSSRTQAVLWAIERGLDRDLADDPGPSSAGPLVRC